MNSLYLSPIVIIWTTLSIVAAVMHVRMRYRIKRAMEKADFDGDNGDVHLAGKILLLSEDSRAVKMILLAFGGLVTIFFFKLRYGGFFILPLPVISILSSFAEARLGRQYRMHRGKKP